MTKVHFIICGVDSSNPDLGAVSPHSFNQYKKICDSYKDFPFFCTKQRAEFEEVEMEVLKDYIIKKALSFGGKLEKDQTVYIFADYEILNDLLIDMILESKAAKNRNLDFKITFQKPIKKPVTIFLADNAYCDFHSDRILLVEQTDSIFFRICRLLSHYAEYNYIN